MFAKRLLALAFIAALFGTAQARDFMFTPYNEKIVMEAQKAAVPTVLTFSKAGCPVCAVQGPLMKKLSMDEKYRSYKFVEIAFEDNESANKKYNVTSQSTLLVLDKSGREVARSTGVTDIDTLRRELDKAI